ncbi:MAG: hydrogenase formation protein HypD [bacterium]|nr:hydrogenase formation protein HypD [bacterium]
MRYVDEYRDADRVRRLADAVLAEATRPVTLMEVCGGQTHTILASGIQQLLTERVELLHGPGCPICVTPLETLDLALALTELPDVTVCSFGDMLRVPGSHGDLSAARARGGDVRVVYAPLDAARLAACEPDRRVVFLAVGFETTVPAVAAAARWARDRGLCNFFLLVSHVRVPPALELIASDPERRIQAFLAAGHVCTVMGTAEYQPIAATHDMPIVVTGFEPVDILQGVLMAVRQIERGEAQVSIQYRRAVRDEGNPAARALIDEVFEATDRPWRGIGIIQQGGLGLRQEYASLDAQQLIPTDALPQPEEPERCRASEVLQGRMRPPECPEFGRGCRPEQPLGAPMVSSEGACAAYFAYRIGDVEDEIASQDPAREAQA